MWTPVFETGCGMRAAVDPNHENSLKRLLFSDLVCFWGFAFFHFYQQIFVIILMILKQFAKLS